MIFILELLTRIDGLEKSRDIKGKRMRIRVAAGNAISISGLAFGIIMLKTGNFFASLISWFCLWYFSHCFAHYIVGRLLGIRFLYYFTGKSDLTKAIKALQKVNFPVLGIKFDRKSVRSKRAAYAMFSAGVLASTLTPFLVPFYLFIAARDFWIFFTLLSIANLTLTAFLSPKYGDIAKAKKFSLEK